MRTYFRSLSDVLGSPLAQTAQTFSPRHAGGHRVLKSTKLEDAAYRDLRRVDNELDALEKACGEKLSTFPALSRDIYQSFYSLNVRRQPEDAISEQARRFNAPILNEVMGGEDYPAIKAACEGRQDRKSTRRRKASTYSAIAFASFHRAGFAAKACRTRQSISPRDARSGGKPVLSHN